MGISCALPLTAVSVRGEQTLACRRESFSVPCDESGMSVGNSCSGSVFYTTVFYCFISVTPTIKCRFFTFTCFPTTQHYHIRRPSVGGNRYITLYHENSG